jgi:hypothetical protein
MGLGEQLWVLWLVYWVSGSFIGAFFGTLFAFGLRALWRKIFSIKEKNQ